MKIIEQRLPQRRVATHFHSPTRNRKFESLNVLNCKFVQLDRIKPIHVPDSPDPALLVRFHFYSIMMASTVSRLEPSPDDPFPALCDKLCLSCGDIIYYLSYLNYN